ncbi:hypothetical protein XENORESO_018538 [Xenotaenia resolanae]|uniref:Uncharacterized protein n=1 Tax=Xenotaenia resolanae TaxID=208358 RepID=A0ABV0VXW6_9TELE
MEFQEPENREGEAVIRLRVGGKTGSSKHCPPYPKTVLSFSCQQGHSSPGPAPACFLYAQNQQPQSPAWPYYEQNQMPKPQSASSSFCYCPSAPVWSSPGQGQFPPLAIPLASLHQCCTPQLHASAPTPAVDVAASSSSNQLSANINRHRRWRQNRAELEDQERLAGGNLPKSGNENRTITINVQFVVRPKTKGLVIHRLGESGTVQPLDRLFCNGRKLSASSES